jgi:endonuclease/exonuclease/phosphatase family metal-dependent hydrolase
MAPREFDRTQQMKIIQLNTWMGRLLPSILKFIAEEQPDILCAQELMDSDNPPALLDQYKTFSELSKLFKYSSFAPTFTFQSYGEEVRYGNAIFSNYPISDEQTTFVYRNFSPNRSAGDDNGNIRNIQSCTVSVDNKMFTVVNHHAYRTANPQGDEQSLSAMNKVNEFLNIIDGALILCADMNLASSSPILNIESLNTLINHTVLSGVPNTLSQHSRVPVEVDCDYIFTSPEIKTSHFEVSEALVSDHKALILDFDL